MCESDLPPFGFDGIRLPRQTSNLNLTRGEGLYTIRDGILGTLSSVNSRYHPSAGMLLYKGIYVLRRRIFFPIFASHLTRTDITTSRRPSTPQ